MESKNNDFVLNIGRDDVVQGLLSIYHRYVPGTTSAYNNKFSLRISQVV
jgi:hypothetical protein